MRCDGDEIGREWQQLGAAAKVWQREERVGNLGRIYVDTVLAYHFPLAGQLSHCVMFLRLSNASQMCSRYQSQVNFGSLLQGTSAFALALL